MTHKEAERQTRQLDTLTELGFTRDEAESLRRISMTLRRWFESECNGERERDEVTGQTYWRFPSGDRAWCADRETSARKRLAAIVATRNKRQRVADAVNDVLGSAASAVSTYIQTDPRGAALYILRPGDVPEGGDPSAYYTRGICVY